MEVGCENHSWPLNSTYKPNRSFAKNASMAKNAQEINLSSLSIVPSANHALGPAASCTLCFEGEGGADLVGGLVELLGIEGGTKAESDTWAEENIVGDGCDTTVVDLDLSE